LKKNSKLNTCLKVNQTKNSTFPKENQELHFKVLDSDSDTDKSKNELIGDLFCTLGEIVGSRGGMVTKKLTNENHPKRENGSITVCADEISETSHTITLKLSCKNLDKMDIIGKSDRKRIKNHSKISQHI
jgi:hypothetical protein